MRQGVFLFIYFYAVLLTLVGCSDGKSVRLSHLGDTPYQQDTIIKHGKTICDAFQKRNVFLSTKNEM